MGHDSSLTTTDNGSINANYTNPGSGAGPASVASRLVLNGSAYPDFCTTAPNGSSPNTTCLTTALTALGTSFAVLEIPAASPTTSNNYVCSWLGNSWAAAQSRVHIWKGAAISCALPPADGTHIIQDDNLATVNPWPAASQPSTIGPAVYVCTSTCNDATGLTPSGAYSATTGLTYGVEISSLGSGGSADSFTWGSSVNGSTFTGGAGGGQITPGIASATYTSGGTLPTNGFCTLSFNGFSGGTGGSGWFPVVSSAAGTVTITAPGYGFTAAPTQATLGGQCSAATATVSTTLTTTSGLIPLTNGVSITFAVLTGHAVGSCPTTGTYTGDCWTVLATPAITVPSVNVNNSMVNSWCTGSFSMGAGGAVYGLVPGAQAVSCVGTLVAMSPPNPVPFACTARNLQVRLGAAPGGSVADVVTLYHNGVAGSLKCTITGSAQTCSDASLGDAVTFAVGDRWVIGYTLGSGSAATNARVSFQCQ